MPAPSENEVVSTLNMAECVCVCVCVCVRGCVCEREECSELTRSLWCKAEHKVKGECDGAVSTWLCYGHTNPHRIIAKHVIITCQTRSSS